MLRQATKKLLNWPIPASAFRGPLSTRSLPEISWRPRRPAFVEAWKKLIPNIDPTPKTPLSFMQWRPPTPLSIP
ncbi:hypothetical protein NL676_019483 [Syzygium grande]|nr:hypothetical protein NL676_019483 [Syzygium grande]